MQEIDYKQFVKDYHDQRLLPNRFTYIRGGQSYGSAGGCMAAFAQAVGTPDKYGYTTPAIIFQGDGAPISFAGLTNEKDYNDCMLAHKRAFNAFEGTPRSLRWVNFLLSDKSPWRVLHEYMMPLEPEWINNAGFIFSKNGSEIPSRLAYNFAMAVRYPWEISRCYELCTRLWDRGIEPVTAVYVSMNFCLSRKATDLTGPYDVRYPWSFLEESGIEAAGRFILGKPGDVKVRQAAGTNNVATLWKTTQDKQAEKDFSDLVSNDNLSLEVILSTISNAVERQKEWIK